MSPLDARFDGALKLIKKKRKLFRDPIALSLALLAALPLHFPVRWCGNVGPTSLLPILGDALGRLPGDPTFLPALIRGVSPWLRPTDPCPIAVHTETFSTSVFKVLI